MEIVHQQIYTLSDIHISPFAFITYFCIMELIDTHAHLYAKDFSSDISSIFDNALANGISLMLLPAIDKKYHDRMIRLALDSPQCLPMMGLHPTSVKNDWKSEIEIVKKHFESDVFVAVGETGIDLYWDKSFLAEQEAAFREQIIISIEKELPLVIHSRESFKEIIGILDDYKNDNLKGVFHCFPGGIKEAEQAIELGFHLGIGGVVTFKNSLMHEVAVNVPLNRILLETDAPWLAPVPYRGKRNEPSYLKIIAEKIAESRGISFEELASQTTNNAKELFKL